MIEQKRMARLVFIIWLVYQAQGAAEFRVASFLPIRKPSTLMASLDINELRRNVRLREMHQATGGRGGQLRQRR